MTILDAAREAITLPFQRTAAALRRVPAWSVPLLLPVASIMSVLVLVAFWIRIPFLILGRGARLLVQHCPPLARLIQFLHAELWPAPNAPSADLDGFRLLMRLRLLSRITLCAATLEWTVLVLNSRCSKMTHMSVRVEQDFAWTFVTVR